MYTYGTRGSPTVGGAAPGLPQRQAAQPLDTKNTIVGIGAQATAWTSLVETQWKIDRDGSVFFAVAEAVGRLDKNGELLWQVRMASTNIVLDGGEDVSPVLAVLLSIGTARYVVALDSNTGEFLWAKQHPAANVSFSGRPVTDQAGYVYFAWTRITATSPSQVTQLGVGCVSGDGSVVRQAVHPTTSSTWQRSAIAAGGGRVFLACCPTSILRRWLADITDLRDSGALTVPSFYWEYATNYAANNLLDISANRKGGVAFNFFPTVFNVIDEDFETITPAKTVLVRGNITDEAMHIARLALGDDYRLYACGLSDYSVSNWRWCAAVFQRGEDKKSFSLLSAARNSSSFGASGLTNAYSSMSDTCIRGWLAGEDFYLEGRRSILLGGRGGVIDASPSWAAYNPIDTPALIASANNSTGASFYSSKISLTLGASALAFASTARETVMAARQRVAPVSPLGVADNLSIIASTTRESELPAGWSD